MWVNSRNRGSQLELGWKGRAVDSQGPQYAPAVAEDSGRSEVVKVGTGEGVRIVLVSLGPEMQADTG